MNDSTLQSYAGGGPILRFVIPSALIRTSSARKSAISLLKATLFVACGLGRPVGGTVPSITPSPSRIPSPVTVELLAHKDAICCLRSSCSAMRFAVSPAGKAVAYLPASTRAEGEGLSTLPGEDIAGNGFKNRTRSGGRSGSFGACLSRYSALGGRGD